MKPISVGIAAIASIALGRSIQAQVPLRLEPEARAASTRSSVPIVFAGLVLDPDGAPAAGAVVVSSAGGQAVTELDGRYRLEVRVPREAERVQITAVGGDGAGLTVSASVSLPGTSRIRSVEPLLLALTPGCHPRWLPTFGGQPGVGGDIHALTVCDDGSGAALYAGGSFLTAGGVAANYIARWDGSDWSALGSGMNGDVRALTVFDDGNGPALYAGGDFTSAGGGAANRIAKWDGSSWSALGSGLNNSVYALTVFDNGSSAALCAGGYFSTAGGVGASRIAKWSGSQWSPLGSGMNLNSLVDALTVFDDGSGPALYAGGTFTSAGGVSANRIAKWSGTSWSALGSGTNNTVFALAVFDDGSGPALFAGGNFTSAGGGAANRIAKWNGSSWSALGSGTNSYPLALAVFDDGSGPALHAGGSFTTAGGVAANSSARWNGSNWTALGSGVGGFFPDVRTFTVFDDGSGPELYAGGHFETAGGLGANGVARWNGSSWSALGGGLDSPVAALAVFDDGSGPALYAGGSFSTASGVAVNCIAKWDGSSWSALGTGVAESQGFASPSVLALAVFDDGSGPALYAGGYFSTAGGVTVNSIAKWSGSGWSALGTGVGWIQGSGLPAVLALAVFDDGSGQALYAGGSFATAGGAPAISVARWDGSNWSPHHWLYGLSVFALEVFDDGDGPALYAGGEIGSGQYETTLAKSDGSSWTAIGAMDGCIEALEVFDDGSGPALYAGGYFWNASGVPVESIAKWNGSSWSALGSGAGDVLVFALEVFDDGRGPALYASGEFTTVDDVAANSIARWDGTSWSALGSGVSGSSSMTVFDDGRGPALFVGGSAFDSGDSFLSKWGCSVPATLQSKVRRR